MTQHDLDDLSQILGAYLHQDWADEFDSDESALRSALDSEPKDKIAAARRALDRLLASQFTEAELREELVVRLGCYFDPSSKGMTYRQWLARVSQLLSQS
jgi:hypothetical protein